VRDLKSGIIPQTYNEEDEYYKDNVDDSEGRTSGNRVFEIWSWPAVNDLFGWMHGSTPEGAQSKQSMF